MLVSTRYDIKNDIEGLSLVLKEIKNFTQNSKIKSDISTLEIEAYKIYNQGQIAFLKTEVNSKTLTKMSPNVLNAYFCIINNQTLDYNLRCKLKLGFDENRNYIAYNNHSYNKAHGYI